MPCQAVPATARVTLDIGLYTCCENQTTIRLRPVWHHPLTTGELAVCWTPCPSLTAMAKAVTSYVNHLAPPMTNTKTPGSVPLSRKHDDKLYKPGALVSWPTLHQVATSCMYTSGCAANALHHANLPAQTPRSPRPPTSLSPRPSSRQRVTSPGLPPKWSVSSPPPRSTARPPHASPPPSAGRPT